IQLQVPANMKSKITFVSCLSLLTIVAFLVGGCTSSRQSADSYEEEFRTLVDYYSQSTESASLNDHTFQNSPQEETDIEEAANEISPETDYLFSSQNRVQPDSPTLEVSLEEFYIMALEYSPQIRVFSDLPLIRQTAIQEAEGAFDTRIFAEGGYNRNNDPIGSTLTTGRTTGRFIQDQYYFEAGVRKKVATGAEVYLSQELSHTENNSEYFVPDPQGAARLSVGFIQPLLKGGGIRYNKSVLQIAEIDSNLAREEFLRQSESHLLEISRSYWALYAARGIYAAKKEGYESALLISNELESREDFDAIRSQILRARAAVAERRAELVRAESAVRNAEDRLKALTNAPEIQFSADEMIPTDLPVVDFVPVSLQEAADSALQNRPEVKQAYLQLQSANIREEQQYNEKLPSLNLFAEAYVAGLAHDDVPQSWDNQFTEGGPGGSIGLRFEFPIANNAAVARLLRRKLETRQLLSQLQAAMDTILLEVKISVRETTTAHRDMMAKYESMQAAREDLENYRQRRDMQLLSRNDAAIGQLQFLLDAQQRQTVAEENFLKALATYNISIVTLERAKGNFLSYESISIEEDEEDDLPVLRLVQNSTEVVSAEPTATSLEAGSTN
ncbi:MAG: TolC family protein, partial [Puniceicoccales bacterium]